MSPDGEFAKFQRNIRQRDYGVEGAFASSRPQETESIEMPMPELDVNIDEGFETFEDIREPQPGLEPPSFMSLDRAVQHHTRGGHAGTGEQSQYHTPGPLIFNRPRPRRPEEASALANIGLQRRNPPPASLDAPPAPKKPRREGNVLHSIDQEGVAKKSSFEPIPLDWTKHGPRQTPSVPSNESVLENTSQVQRTAVAKHWEQSRKKEEDDDDRITALDQQIKSRVNIYRWLGEVEEDEHPAFDKRCSEEEEEEVDNGERQKDLADRTFDASRLTGKVFGVHQDDNTKLVGDDTRATAGVAPIPPHVLHDSTNITTMSSERKRADKKLERDAFGQPSNASRREYGEPSQNQGEWNTNISRPVHQVISELRGQQTSPGRQAAEYVRSSSTTPIVVPSTTYRQPRPTRRYELEAYTPRRVYDAAGGHPSDNHPAVVINTSTAPSQPNFEHGLDNHVQPIDTQQPKKSGLIRRLFQRIKSPFRRHLTSQPKPPVISQPHDFMHLNGSRITPTSSAAAMTSIPPPRPSLRTASPPLNSNPYRDRDASQGQHRPKTRGKRRTHNKDVTRHSVLHPEPQSSTTNNDSPPRSRAVEATTTTSTTTSTPTTIILPAPISSHTRPTSRAAAVQFNHTHRRGTTRERSVSPPHAQARHRPPPPTTRYMDGLLVVEETFVVTRRGSWGRRLRDLGIEDNTVVFG